MIHVVHDIVITKGLYARKYDCKNDICESPNVPTLHSGFNVNDYVCKWFDLPTLQANRVGSIHVIDTS